MIVTSFCGPWAPGALRFVKVSVTSRSIKPLLQTSLSAHDLSALAEMDEGTASQLLGEAAYNNNPWAVVAILSLKLISVNTVLPGPGEFQKHTALLIACLQKHSCLVITRCLHKEIQGFGLFFFVLTWYRLKNRALLLLELDIWPRVF